MTAPLSEPLSRWYERAGVRRDARRRLGGEPIGPDGGLPFPPRLVPTLSHRAASGLAPEVQAQVLIRQLHGYLHFTVRFELGMINPAAEQIATGATGFELPERTRLEAFGIYCDEGFHALYCADLLHQIEQTTGVSCRSQRYTTVEGRIDEIVGGLPARLAATGRLLVAVVFETLVSQILADLPDDPSVLACVRQVVRDHARDERRHHAYFAQVFGRIWPQLAPADRTVVGVVLPDLLLAVLSPDLFDVVEGLVDAGFDPEVASAVVADVCNPESVLVEARRTAQATLDLFRRTGLLTDPLVAEAFVASGLIPRRNDAR
jgi:hypothetical protein